MVQRRALFIHAADPADLELWVIDDEDYDFTRIEQYVPAERVEAFVEAHMDEFLGFLEAEK